MPSDAHRLRISSAWVSPPTRAIFRLIASQTPSFLAFKVSVVSSEPGIRRDWKLVVQSDGYTELYRLLDDPSEMRDLAIQRRYQDKFCTIREALCVAGITLRDMDFHWGAIGK